MQALHGTWNVVALEVDGSKMTEGVFGSSQIILQGDTFRTVSMGADYEGTFIVDDARTPHTIDISFIETPHRLAVTVLRESRRAIARWLTEPLVDPSDGGIFGLKAPV